MFVQPEPNVWIVLVLVNQQVPAPPPTAFPASTDTTAAAATASAVAAANSRRTTLTAAIASIERDTFSTDAVSDAVLFAVVRRLYDMHALFYGSLARVVEEPRAAAFIKRLGDLRCRMRKLVDRKDTLVSNYESMLKRAADAAMRASGAGGSGSFSPSPGGGSSMAARAAAAAAAAAVAAGARVGSAWSASVSAGPIDAPPTPAELDAVAQEVQRVARDADSVAAELSLLSRFSPAAALRATLRNTLDFAAHYTDWTALSPFDGVDALRCPQSLNHKAWRAVVQVCGELEMRQPLVSQVALLYDGYAICGHDMPALDALYSYLRLHAFHVLRGSYVPDLRPMEFTALAPAPPPHHASLAAAPPPAGLGMGMGIGAGAGSGVGIGPGAMLAGPGRPLAAAGAVGTARAVSAPGPGPAPVPGAPVITVTEAPWSAALAPPALRGMVREFIGRAASAVATAAGVAEAARTMPSWLLAQCTGLDRNGGSGSGRGEDPDAPVDLRSALAAGGSAGSGALGSARSAASDRDRDPLSALMGPPPAAPLVTTVTSPAYQSAAGGGGGPGSSGPFLSLSTRMTLSSAQPSPQGFYRGVKPAMLAVPALPASAAARRCLKSAVTVEADWPVLNLPYVAADFLASLAQLLPHEVQAALAAQAAANSASLASPTRARIPADAAAIAAAGGSPVAASAGALVIASPGTAAPAAAGSVSPASPASPPTAMRPPAAETVILSTGAIGPPLARRILLPPGAQIPAGTAVGPGTSIVRTGPDGGPPAIAAPIVLDDSQLIFCPPLFATNAGAAAPSHRLLWYQQGLVTLLCYVDANALTAADKGAAAQIQRAAAAAAAAAAASSAPAGAGIGPAAGGMMVSPMKVGPGAGVGPAGVTTPGSGGPLSIGPAASPASATPGSALAVGPPRGMPGSLGIGAGMGMGIGAPSAAPLAGLVFQHLDVPPQPLQDLAARVREFGTSFLAGVEAALSEAVDFAASQAASSGLEGTKHAHGDTGEGVLQVHGYSTVSRRPGKGRDPSGAPVSQAAPILSSAFDGEVPRHLTAHLAAAKDALLRRTEPMAAPRVPYAAPSKRSRSEPAPAGSPAPASSPQAHSHAGREGSAFPTGASAAAPAADVAGGSGAGGISPPPRSASVGAGGRSGSGSGAASAAASSAAASRPSMASRRRYGGLAGEEPRPPHPLAPAHSAGHEPSLVGLVMMAGLRSAAVRHEARKMRRRHQRRADAETRKARDEASAAAAMAALDGDGSAPVVPGAAAGDEAGPAHDGGAAGRDITASHLPSPPSIEEHVLACRYDGGVACRRAGSHETFVVFDGKTPGMSDMSLRLAELSAAHGAP